MELRQVEEKVTVLQAHVRGYLVRKRFQSLLEEYASIVKQIEGNCECLYWRGTLIPTPEFSQTKSTKIKPTRDGENIAEDNKHVDRAPEAHPTFDDGPEKDLSAGREVRPVNAISELRDAPPELEDKSLLAAKHCGVESLAGEDVVESSSRNPLDSESSFKESKDMLNCSNATSVWNSTIMDSRPSLIPKELTLQTLGTELPKTVEGLRQYRSDLAMELLWLQQAITSRKNYLALKQRLGTPD